MNIFSRSGRPGFQVENLTLRTYGNDAELGTSWPCRISWLQVVRILQYGKVNITLSRSAMSACISLSPAWFRYLPLTCSLWKTFVSCIHPNFTFSFFFFFMQTLISLLSIFNRYSFGYYILWRKAVHDEPAATCALPETKPWWECHVKIEVAHVFLCARTVYDFIQEDNVTVSIKKVCLAPPEAFDSADKKSKTKKC